MDEVGLFLNVWLLVFLFFITIRKDILRRYVIVCSHWKSDKIKYTQVYAVCMYTKSSDL